MHESLDRLRDCVGRGCSPLLCHMWVCIAFVEGATRSQVRGAVLAGIAIAEREGRKCFLKLTH